MGGVSSATSQGTLNPYPDRQKMYSTVFNSFIEDLKTEVNALTTDSIQTFLTNIRNMESNIGNTYNLNDLETRIAYLGSSLTRYSGAYWVNQFEKFNSSSDNSPWAQKNIALGGDGWDGPESKPPKWVYDDISSFFGGSYVYATIGVAAGASGGTALITVAASAGVSSAIGALS